MKKLENIGIGIDIVDVDRFKKIPYESKKSFYQKNFHPSEIKYCLKFKDSYRRFAGKFAIKEALKKSITQSVSLPDIITSHSNSKPQVSLINNNNYRFHVSLSHENKFVVAIVVSEKI